jgi:hypothetical protein
MTGFKSFGDKPACARIRFGIEPEMIQANGAHVVSQHRHNGDESQAINLRYEVSACGSNARQTAQEYSTSCAEAGRRRGRTAFHARLWFIGFSRRRRHDVEAHIMPDSSSRTQTRNRACNHLFTMSVSR